MKILRKFLRNNKGATAIEYAFIATLISVAAVAALQGIGTKVSGSFNNVTTGMK